MLNFLLVWNIVLTVLVGYAIVWINRWHYCLRTHLSDSKQEPTLALVAEWKKCLRKHPKGSPAHKAYCKALRDAGVNIDGHRYGD